MFKIAYCSNVHAGADVEQTRENLANHAVTVKQLFRPKQPMGIGLWLSANSALGLKKAEDAGESSPTTELGQFLAEHQLDPFTFNGFPFGNFHQDVVKKDVYLPTWFETDRLRYTKSLVRLIQQFSDAEQLSISTLPIAWGNPTCKPDQLNQAASNFREIAEFCREVEVQTGRLVYICIEPEPGCQIQYSQDIVEFFESYLLTDGDEETIRRHIRVCHDVCHAVVMCESQESVFQRYQQAGIHVGKVQISSAVVVDFDSMAANDRAEAIQQVSAFAEDRYLHQTTITSADQDVRFFEDLPVALRSIDSPEKASGTWRIHFHVPIHLREFGLLQASQQEIVDCVSTCRRYSDVTHFEVETYAWNVLPPDLQEETLAVGIAKELTWFDELAKQHLEGESSE